MLHEWGSYIGYIISRIESRKHYVYPWPYTIVCMLAIHHSNGTTHQRDHHGIEVVRDTVTSFKADLHFQQNTLLPLTHLIQFCTL